MSFEFLWYIPNQVTPGHRGEPVTAAHNSLIKRQGDQLLPLLRG
jgi:hypothetical protein